MITPGSENRIAGSQDQRLAWFLLLGVIIGLSFLVVVQLPKKWFALLFAGFLTVPLAFAASNRKGFIFFLALLTYTVPVWIGLHLGYRKTPWGRSTFGFPIHISMIPLFALYVSWIINRVVWKWRTPVSTRGLGSLAGLLAAGACSLLVAKEPIFATFDLFALASSIAIFIYISSQVTEIKDLRLVVIVLVAAAFFQAVIAILQKLTGLPLSPFKGAMALIGYAGLETVSRVGGWVGHPNALAMFFDLLLPLSFSLLFYPMRRSFKLFLAGAVALEVLALGVTYSRGGIISSSLALFLLLLFHWKKRVGLTRAVFGVLSMAVVAGTLLLVIPNPLRTGLLRSEGTAGGRLRLIEVAENIIKDRPLLGTGLNNFVVTARPYDHTPEQIVSAWNSPVHNLFFFIGSEMGLIGLGFFLLFLWRVMTWLYAALGALDPFLLCVGAGLFFGLLAFFTHAQVDYCIWTQDRLLWFLLGLAIAIGRLARSSLENQEATALQESMA